MVRALGATGENRADRGCALKHASTPARSPLTAARTDRRVKGVVLLLTLSGLALRLWGIGWSLPDRRHPLATYHPDELVNLSAALAVDIPHGRFDTGFYNYGTLYFYMVSFAQTVGRGWGVIPPPPAPAAAGLPEPAALAGQAPEQAALFLTGRLLTAVLGAGTIPVIFLLGSSLYGRRAGAAGALLYAVAPLAVVHAHFLTVDVPATFFTALALLQAARLLERSGARAAALAGIWCALAAATKYTAGLVIVAPAVALVAAFPAGERSRALRPLALLAVVSALVFLIACPGPWINARVFWEGSYPGSGLRYELFEHARSGHGTLFVDTGPGWLYHLRISLRFGLGLPLLLFTLAGVVWALVRRRRSDAVLVVFLLVSYLAAGSSAVRFARYMIPLFPALCVLAGRLCAEPVPVRLYRNLAPALTALVALLAGAQSLALCRAMAARDPRDRAADWLFESAPQSARIAFAKTPWFFSPPLSPYFGAPDPRLRIRGAALSTRFQFRMPAAEWDADVLTPPPDYVVLSNLETQHDLARLRLKPAVDFYAKLTDSTGPSSAYRRRVFHPVSLFGPAVPEETQIPEDLLYTLPTITVFHRPELPDSSEQKER